MIPSHVIRSYTAVSRMKMRPDTSPDETYCTVQMSIEPHKDLVTFVSANLRS